MGFSKIGFAVGGSFGRGLGIGDGTAKRSTRFDRKYVIV